MYEINLERESPTTQSKNVFEASNPQLLFNNIENANLNSNESNQIIQNVKCNKFKTNDADLIEGEFLVENSELTQNLKENGDITNENSSSNETREEKELSSPRNKENKCSLNDNQIKKSCEIQKIDSNSNQTSIRINNSIKEKLFVITKIKKTNNWNSQEDELLISLAARYKQKSWAKVAKEFTNKTPAQCRARYKRIRPGIVKGSWSEREDKQIISLVEAHGKNWALISKFMKTRNGKQIRDRFLNYLDPSIKKNKFTDAEDIRIVKYYKEYGPKWSLISQFFDGRTGDMIKNRFHSCLRRKVHVNEVIKVRRKIKRRLKIGKKLNARKFKQGIRKELKASHEICHNNSSEKQSNNKEKIIRFFVENKAKVNNNNKDNYNNNSKTNNFCPFSGKQISVPAEQQRNENKNVRILIENYKTKNSNSQINNTEDMAVDFSANKDINNKIYSYSNERKNNFEHREDESNLKNYLKLSNKFNELNEKSKLKNNKNDYYPICPRLINNKLKNEENISPNLFTDLSKNLLNKKRKLGENILSADREREDFTDESINKKNYSGGYENNLNFGNNQNILFTNKKEIDNNNNNSVYLHLKEDLENHKGFNENNKINYLEFLSSGNFACPNNINAHKDFNHNHFNQNFNFNHEMNEAFNVKENESNLIKAPSGCPHNEKINVNLNIIENITQKINQKINFYNEYHMRHESENGNFLNSPTISSVTISNIENKIQNYEFSQCPLYKYLINLIQNKHEKDQQGNSQNANNLIHKNNNNNIINPYLGKYCMTPNYNLSNTNSNLNTKQNLSFIKPNEFKNIYNFHKKINSDPNSVWIKSLLNNPNNFNVSGNCNQIDSYKSNSGTNNLFKNSNNNGGKSNLDSEFYKYLLGMIDYLYLGNISDFSSGTVLSTNFSGSCPLRYINLEDENNNININANNVNNVNNIAEDLMFGDNNFSETGNFFGNFKDNKINNSNLSQLSFYDSVNDAQKNFNNNIKYTYKLMLDNIKKSLNDDQ